MQAPPGSVDCHVHIFDPVRFAYAETRRYTPPPATVSDLQRMHASLGIERTVFVQPSVYGSDNRCLLEAIRQYGPAARGVAVIASSCSPGQLEDLYAAGVRGIRLNLEVRRDQDASNALRQLDIAIDKVGRLPMLIQIYAATSVLLACGPTLRALPNPVLIDHFGKVSAKEGVHHPDFIGLLELLESRHIWIKLSGPHQISSASDRYSDVATIASSFVTTAPDRVVWGSDWPHTGGSKRLADYLPTDIEAFRPVNDQEEFELVWHWTRTREEREHLLAFNPAKLFGF